MCPKISRLDVADVRINTTKQDIKKKFRRICRKCYRNIHHNDCLMINFQVQNDTKRTTFC